jgi:hypothetical protein
MIGLMTGIVYIGLHRAIVHQGNHKKGKEEIDKIQIGLFKGSINNQKDN